MKSFRIDSDSIAQLAAPQINQHELEIQPYGHIVKLPNALPESACAQAVQNLNQLLADSIALRDLYRKHHWQLSGATFSQLHALYDRHYKEQDRIVDEIAERIQSLGGVSVAVAHDVADLTLIPRPPRGRESVPAQISRMLHAHEIILYEARAMARIASDHADDGTNDLIVSSVIRGNERQVWFVAEHIVTPPSTT